MRGMHMLAGGVVVFTASAMLAGQCYRDTTKKCCDIATTSPPTRPPCPNDPPDEKCSALVLGNPSVPWVSVVDIGQKAPLTFPGQQECKWQNRYCNNAGHCTAGSVQTSLCTPSQLMGPPQDCP